MNEQSVERTIILENVFLPNISMHIVSSKTVVILLFILYKVTVQTNNQNSGDFNTSVSFISILTAEPGMNISIVINRLLIAVFKTKTALRHLYLSVIAPISGRTNKPRSGIIVKIKPTMTGE